MSKLGRILKIVGIVILALAVIVGGFGVYTVRRSFPQTNGTVKAPGLTEAVDVYRDERGIAHVYADNTHDLFFAQGYVHAQERFYQMDFWRHITSGRLSELYGEASLGRDRFLRTLGWWRVAEQEYAQLDPETKAVLDAYAEGVNAYIGDRSAADLSLEYSILGLTGLKNYQPEPWSPVSALAWAKAMAWDLRSNMDEEIERAVLLNALGPEKTADYLPLYPADHPDIVPNPPTASLAPVQARLTLMDDLLGARTEGVGSNSWVVAGSRTATGTPLLANDPHLSIQMPSIWYEIGVHCRTVTQACPYDFYGVSFAGVPGIVIGHNNRIAWGLTFLPYDVQDLYMEKINPANPDQYEVNGQWVDMTLVHETIRVKGGGEEDLTVRYTRHGPIINDVYWDGKDVTVNGTTLGPDSGYAIALRWTALDPGTTLRALLNVNRAQNWQEFRAALRDWVVPPHNVIYADVDGNIGYEGPGFVPIRRNGGGQLPVPGWTDDYEWTGYIPFDELPYSFNPPQGYIATANNAVVGPDYPYWLGAEWDAGYRAARIVDLLEAQPKISIEYIQQMQADALNLGAQEVLPRLLALSFDDPKLAAALDELRSWDFQMRLDSQPAAVYLSFFNALLKDTFHDDLPEKYWPSGGPSNWVTVRALLTNPNNSWWDNAGTPAVETRDDILKQAFAEGYAALERRLGADSSNWTWGALHTATFKNATLGSSGVAPIEAIFNRGPFSTPGGYSIVDNTTWNMTRDDWETPGDPYAVGTLPSMRMIVDLGNLPNSVITHTTGQSGHAYHPHYIDMADDWRLVRYHPMLWNPADVEAQAEGHLTLTP